MTDLSAEIAREVISALKKRNQTTKTFRRETPGRKTNMKKHTSQKSNFAGWKSALLITMALVLFGTAPAWAQHFTRKSPAKARIVRPEDRYKGTTYAEWSAEWWRWFMEFPVQDKQGNPLPHPSFDDPNFDVRDQQQGDVWFLAETSPITVRTCDIPHGKSLFVALHTAEASNLEDLGDTEAEQRATAKWFADHIVGSFFEIDGHPVADIASYRVASPQFKFKAPTPWIFGATGGNGTSVGDGYYVLLEPLPRGHHTIHYGGSYHFSIAEGDPFDLELPSDTTYHLNVR